jgi:uncharacterized protein with NRDE domain
MTCDYERMLPDRFLRIQGQLDSIWQQTDVVRAELNTMLTSDDVPPRDMITLATVAGLLTAASEAAKCAASQIGRTSTQLWERS